MIWRDDFGNISDGWSLWLCGVDCAVQPAKDGTRDEAMAIERAMVRIPREDVQRVVAMRKEARRAWGLARSAEWRRRMGLT